MALHRLLLRALRRASATSHFPLPQHLHSHPPHTRLTIRPFAFSSAEEAAAERRRRKRRLRIEPPLHALRRDPSAPRPAPDPRLPDTTSALTGRRLNLHNRVQSLIRAGDLDSAALTARQSVFSNTRPTVFTCNAIIAAMYRAKRYQEAVALFHFFFKQFEIVPNIVSYNYLIVSYCESGSVDMGLEIYRNVLPQAPFSPSSVTYRHLTQGLIDSGRIGEAYELLKEMLHKGHGADSLVFNNLVKGYLKLGDLGKANEIFDELKERCLVYDGVVNASFMDWFFSQGREREAMESYRSLLDRQFKMVPATCNVLLEVLLKHGKKEEAWGLFDSMLDNHTPPVFQAVNSDTFNIMVNECFKEGKFDEAVNAFRKVGKAPGSRPFSMDVAGYTNIVVKFCEHGMISDAEKFFEELQSKSLSPDVTGYKTLIDAYLNERRIDDAVRMFHRMVDANLRVISEYANRWCSQLIQNGKVLEASQILTKMGERDPKPDFSTYEIVINGLLGIGEFDASRDIISQLVRYGIGFPPSFRESLYEAYEKAGRNRSEIDNLLNEWRTPYATYRHPSSPQPLRHTGPPRFAGPVWQSNPVGLPAGQQVQGPVSEPARYPGTDGNIAGLGVNHGSVSGSTDQTVYPSQFGPQQVSGRQW